MKPCRGRKVDEGFVAPLLGAEDIDEDPAGRETAAAPGAVTLELRHASTVLCPGRIVLRGWLGGCYALMDTREKALAELEHVFALIELEHRDRGAALPKVTTEIVHA